MPAWTVIVRLAASCSIERCNPVVLTTTSARRGGLPSAIATAGSAVASLQALTTDGFLADFRQEAAGTAQPKSLDGYPTVLSTKLVVTTNGMSDAAAVREKVVYQLLGKTLDENYRAARCYDTTVIRPLAEPLQPAAGIAVLHGNLCEQGAVIKPSAATPALLRHRGPAVVFSSMEDYHARIDTPELAITADSVIVLLGVGPRG